MKRIILLAFLVSAYVNAQNFSYGIILGGDFYEAANSGSTPNFNAQGSNLTPNIGGYAEYSFSNKIGIKTEITFNKKTIEFTGIDSGFNMSFLQISPSLKYDCGPEYRKGFYMLLGPKLSIITKVTSEGVDVKDSFESSNFALQYGIGTRFYKYFDIEGKLDYEFTPFYKTSYNTSSFLNFYINLGIDLERLLNKS